MDIFPFLTVQASCVIHHPPVKCVLGVYSPVAE